MLFRAYRNKRDLIDTCKFGRGHYMVGIEMFSSREQGNIKSRNRAGYLQMR